MGFSATTPCVPEGIVYSILFTEYFMCYGALESFHILDICHNFVCFDGISLMSTLCDTYYEENESH